MTTWNYYLLITECELMNDYWIEKTITIYFYGT